MIRIAIDGPGGAGKSTVAKAVAKKLGIIYVDTGALYRTIGLYMLKNGVDPKCTEDVVARLNDFTLELKFENGKQTILLNGKDVGDEIREPNVSMAASSVSAIKEVREYLLNTQRNIAEKNSVIMDGRDIGTVILPSAEVKIFLTASPESRAKRRYEELISKGKDITYEQVYTEMVERDKNDSTREIAPCVPASDAIMLDNSDLTAEGTANAVIKIVKKKSKKLNRRNGYMKTHLILAPLVRFFCNAKALGLENIPKEGGVVLCANHIAIRDVLLIGACCPRQVRFIAKKELFSVPVIGWIIKKFGAVKVDRGGSDVGAIRKSVDLVKGGDLVAIFPQGHRYPGEHPQETPIKHGAGLIAYKSSSDIIPVCIKTKNFRYSIFRKTSVIFGKPIKFNDLGFVSGGTEEYRAVTERIMGEIAALGGYALPAPKSKEEN